MNKKSGTERQMQLVGAAQKLFFTYGYESTSIEDIANEVGVSTGAFYHYFDSKYAIVTGVIDLFLESALSALKQIVANPDMNAIEKFNAYFLSSQTLSELEMAELWATLNILYKPENAHLRHWLGERQREQIIPEFAKIIDQGIEEGLFDVANSKYSAELLLAMILTTDNAGFKVLADTDRPANALEMLNERCDSAQHGMERILGIPAGSFDLISNKTLARWLAEPA